MSQFNFKLFFDTLFSGGWNQITIGLCFSIPAIILLSFRSNERLVSYIPPFCTSVGILMTFSVLYYTLGIDIENILKATTGTGNQGGTNQESITNLIQQLSNKFSCSLIGIFFSILWSVVIKFSDGRNELKLKRSQAWKQKDPQELLWELTQAQPRLIAAIGENRGAIENGFASSEEQRDSRHKEFMGKIDNVGTYIQNNLQQSLTDFNDLLTKHIEQMGLDALANSRANIEAIQTKLTELSEKMLENHKDSLSQTFEDIRGLATDALRSSKENIETIQREATERSTELLKNHQDSLVEALEAIRKTVSGLTPVMQTVVEKLEGQMQAHHDNASKNIQTIQEGFKTSTNEMVGQFSTKALELNEALGKITQTISSMDEKVQSSSQKVLQNHLEQIESTFNSLKEMQCRAKTILEESTGQFAKAVEEYKGVQSNNGEVLNRIEEQIEILSGLQENAKQQLDLWSEQFEEVEEMRNRLNDIGNVVDQLQDLNDRLGSVLAISNTNHR